MQRDNTTEWNEMNDDVQLWSGGCCDEEMTREGTMTTAMTTTMNINMKLNEMKLERAGGVHVRISTYLNNFSSLSKCGTSTRRSWIELSWKGVPCHWSGSHKKAIF